MTQYRGDGSSSKTGKLSDPYVCVLVPHRQLTALENVLIPYVLHQSCVFRCPLLKAARHCYDSREISRREVAD